MKLFGKFIRGRLFEILFTLFAILSIFYVSDRMGHMIKGFCDYDATLIAFSVLVVFFGYMFFYMRSKKQKKETRNIYESCTVVACFFLYLVMLLWVVDIADLIFKIQEDRIYLVAVILSIIFVFYGFFHAKKLYLKEYNITLKNGKKGKKIVLLSDIHVGTFVDIHQLEKIVSAVNNIHADQIIIAGDMFDVDAFTYCDKEKIAEVLLKLEPKGCIFASLGNHDPCSANDEIKKFYKDANITLLIDEIQETNNFFVVGRDDIATNPKRNSLKYIINQVDKKEKLVLVIDHNPLGIKEAVEEDVDLILCGHTHKGQFFPANIFTKLAYGKQGFYGYYKERNTQSIVSSGAGFFQMPMRICSNSEIVIINL